MGNIPATSNMISAMITNPQPGVTLQAGTTFNIEVQTSHLAAGNFVNPTTQYYTAPQDLDSNGDIIGHCHVTVQDIGQLQSTTPPDPSQFVFFKGIDDDGNGQGLLSTTVEGGLPAGVYRVCTMIAAQNHQPVTMPVAQRGAQDDCTKFEVVDSQGGGNQGGNQNGNQGDQNNNQGGQNGGRQNGDQGGDQADQQNGNQGGDQADQQNPDQGGDQQNGGQDDDQANQQVEDPAAQPTEDPANQGGDQENQTADPAAQPTAAPADQAGGQTNPNQEGFGRGGFGKFRGGRGGRGRGRFGQRV
ncbi:uncharacterized protein BKA55DRAFT_571601 [Fusarium redolens]|uniref:Uncharacterized protein n=1 Tax=Fusarium redolens TaxID=48865 RepID=A0A9P9K815_FUSRE|nr:uncharacterized protein BKA55DRAFT_571601 [Fusarium redolens]KAH7247365.1 hypothetical protein BKA55DRAFT_571601 [Fusarium redolens]